MNNTPSNSYVDVTEQPRSHAPEAAHIALMTRYHFVRETAPGGALLEVACGPGIGLGYLAQKYEEVVGLDIAPANVEVARATYQDRFTVLVGDAQELPFEDARFDVVAMLDAIYWVPDAQRFLREAFRVLRPGGRLVLSTLNIEWVGWTPGWAAPMSTRYWTAPELRELCEGAGFAVEQWMGAHDDGRGFKRKLVQTLRKLLFASPLAPKTLAGRERIKRLVFRNTRLLPMVLEDGHAELDPLVPLRADTPRQEYHMIYVRGTKPLDESATLPPN